MMFLRRSVLLLAMVAAWASPGAWGQSRCQTMELIDRLTPEQRRYLPGGDVFEHRLAMAKASRTDAICDSGQIVRIPVVFHVIHNGEALGQGANLPDQRLIEQIDILNQDYRRAFGTPGYNTDARGLDAGIEFYLACLDPSGNPTNGIVRRNGRRAQWDISDNDSLKAQSVWPTDRYLNIWICNLTNNNLGYASFPSTTLPFGSGIIISQPEGVVGGYRFVGYSGNVNYGLGRTLTHEIGHFFGLIHIWGDGDCSASDFCDDTPPQNGPELYCPRPGAAIPNCPGQPPYMLRNYMGYVQDSCMNIFTRDQVYRMRYVLCNTPNRASLRQVQSCFTGMKPLLPKVVQIKNNRPDARGAIELQFNDSGPAIIEVISVDGKRLGTWRCAPATRGEDYGMDLSFLSSGVYALIVTQNQRREVQRVYVGR